LRRQNESERIAEKVASALGRENAIMRISPLVLLLMFAMLGCGSGTQPSSPSVTPAVTKTPDAATVKKQMTPAQLELGDPIANSVGMFLVPIPAGEFLMGSLDSYKSAHGNEKPQHLVKITKPFYLSVNEVTQQQYEKVMGVRPWHGKGYMKEGPDYAATYVSWNDAVEFCRKLSEQDGVEYRLPTEAQWEYTCRAGTTTTYSFGDDVSKLEEYAWYTKNALKIGQNYAHRVGQKQPNPWGLNDMHGNVLEWCQEEHGPGSRVLRGGSFYLDSAGCRSAFRSFWRPDILLSIVGFRVSRTYN